MKISRKHRAAALALVGASCTVYAQQPASKDQALRKEAAKEEITKVEIKGSGQDYDARRDDTASKTVITQEDIMKYGDTNVYDVLKRAPGVTITGNNIRMRGLSNGYTQILVNGERPPPGFSIDNLTPDQIERIEIVRAASAEFSMQAIAGTVNIVLKKLVSRPQRDLRLNATGARNDNKNVNVSGTLADRSGKLSYFINGFLNHAEGKPTSYSGDQFYTPAGQLVQARELTAYQDNRNSALGLQPRLSWKLDNDDQLTLSGFLQIARNDNGNDTVTNNLVGSFPAPDYIRRVSDTEVDIRFMGGELNWVTKLAGGKLDAKVGAFTGKVDVDYNSLASTVGNAVNLRRVTSSDSDYTTYSTSGKYTRSLEDGHNLSTGWEIRSERTDEDRVRVEGFTTVAPTRIVEQFKPQVTRMAVFAQDEWNVTKQWSVYLGARWETIRTESEGSGLQATESRNNVLSPVAQTLYKFPDKSGRQLRAALTRTFKAPTVQQLTARRIESDLNTRFNPDSSGNPYLKPELATGIDLTYEHFWAPGAVFSVGTSVRRITDYIRTTLGQDAKGYWLNRPVNDGTANVRTLDLELKFPLQTVWKEGPAVDLRASANRNWSQVDSVPGPDNRLDQQIPISATLGADYKIDASYTVGGSLAFRSGGPVRISEQQSAQLYARRDLEAYLLYKVRPGLQLRFTANNLLGEDNRSLSRYADASGASQNWSRTPASVRLGANAEIKF